MLRTRILGVFILLLGILIGYAVYATEQTPGRFSFKLGLDLNGGTRLLYDADISGVSNGEVSDALSVLKEVIERRVNLFGVSEPLVRIERSFDGGVNRVAVELPGVTDSNEAIRLIGQTPLLEFRLLAPNLPQSEEELKNKPVDDIFISTGLTGRYIKRAQVTFGSSQAGIQNEPTVLMEFNEEGKKLFAKITRENVNKTLAIFLDGTPISTPVIREEITEGTAQISGNFTPVEARDLVRNLNYGALPLPISLLSTEKVGPTLGKDTLNAGIKAGIAGFLFIIIFLLLWYRLPGLIASLALVFYGVLVLLLFKLIPVTLTSAGIAGFILSLGMAVDANVLIFERMKEELRKGKTIKDALEEGFSRAWLSIRDSNTSSIITASILFWFGTSVVKGFALTLGLGVFVSMISAIIVTKTFLKAIAFKDTKISRFLFNARRT